MKKTVEILVALALVVVGVGVVRPQTVQRIEEAWQPVVEKRIEVPLREGESVELNELGEYVVFVDGPARDPLWETAGDTWVTLVDRGAGRPLAAGRHGADFSYERDGRRAEAVARVAVTLSGEYELSLGRADTKELEARDFKASIVPADLVVEQSRQATTWMVAGIAAGVVLGVIAISLATRKPV